MQQEGQTEEDLKKYQVLRESVRCVGTIEERDIE